jgi:hypothetical protein
MVTVSVYYNIYRHDVGVAFVCVCVCVCACVRACVRASKEDEKIVESKVKRKKEEYTRSVHIQ